MNLKMQEPIAIIGIGCRFPGSEGAPADTPEKFWNLLENGANAITPIPTRHWDAARYEAVIPNYGSFIPHVDLFDASFFHVSPKEAMALDPQQRRLLEVSWEAIEHAGMNPETLRGSDTGVFVGIFSNDYQLLQVQQREPHLYFSTGTSAATASGRIAYFFDLHGPAVSIDTASSSSLVAFHQAVMSVHGGECQMALAAGVNLILAPDLNIAFARANMLARDGRSKSFDASADGYVRGEGCGVVLLKRLADALRDGDHVLALVRGTAINQDGASQGLTVPSGPAQAAVIRQALSVAGLEPQDVTYIEAHGSGTPVGDPIEGQALQAVYGAGRTSPWVIGSVKTNIGHLEAAAGIAGLIKAVLALQHEYIPPHLHFSKLNPKLDGLEAIIPTEGMKWPTNGSGPRRAGVSSFGFSGTNAHVILEEAPSPPPSNLSGGERYHLLTLSAKDEQGLLDLAERYNRYLAAHPEIELADLCYTANTGRTHFEHRLAAIAESTDDLREQLSTFTAGEAAIGLVSADALSPRPKIAFLFTGQGSQYVGMGRQLYETEPIFRRALSRCDHILSPLLGRSLLDILYPAHGVESAIDETAYTQPALLALEYALAELWKSWGIEPDVVMGHSVGEIAAACVAGVFSLEDGLKLIAERGRLMQRLPNDGAMVTLLTEPARVADAMAPYASRVSLAIFNGPQHVVISGERQAVQEVVDALPDVRAIKLKVSHAFHSPLMEPILAEFERFAKQITFSTPNIGFISNVEGNVAHDVVTTPEYWARHIREAVRFADGMTALHEQNVDLFVEIGPKPTLLGMGQRCLSPDVGCWLPTLQPEQLDWQVVLQSLSEMYLCGVPIAWSAVEGERGQKRLVLPTYPFQRQRYWGIASSQPYRESQPTGDLASPPAPVAPATHQPNEREVQPPLLEQLTQGSSSDSSSAGPASSLPPGSPVDGVGAGFAHEYRSLAALLK